MSVVAADPVVVVVVVIRKAGKFKNILPIIFLSKKSQSGKGNIKLFTVVIYSVEFMSR